MSFYFKGYLNINTYEQKTVIIQSGALARWFGGRWVEGARNLLNPLCRGVQRTSPQPPNFVTVFSRNKLNGKSGFDGNMISESSQNMDHLQWGVNKDKIKENGKDIR